MHVDNNLTNGSQPPNNRLSSKSKTLPEQVLRAADLDATSGSRHRRQSSLRRSISIEQSTPTRAGHRSTSSPSHVQEKQCASDIPATDECTEGGLEEIDLDEVHHTHQQTCTERSASLQADPKMKELRRQLSRSLSDLQARNLQSMSSPARPASAGCKRRESKSRPDRPASAAARLQRQRTEFANIRRSGLVNVEHRVRTLSVPRPSSEPASSSHAAAFAAKGSRGGCPLRPPSCVQATPAPGTHEPHILVTDASLARQSAPKLAFQEKYNRSLKRLLLDLDLGANDLAVGISPQADHAARHSSDRPGTSKAFAMPATKLERVHEYRCKHLDKIHAWHDQHQGNKFKGEDPLSSNHARGLNHLRFDTEQQVMPGSLRPMPARFRYRTDLDENVQTKSHLKGGKTNFCLSQYADAEAVFKASLWTLRKDGNKLADEDWLEVDYWTSIHGDLIYYSQQEKKNLVHYEADDLSDASISIISQQLPSDACIKPWAFSVKLSLASEDIMFAASDAQSQQEWIQALSDAGRAGSVILSSQ